MPIIKCKSHIDVYEYRTKSKDPHELSGRGLNKQLTQFISRNILNEISLTDTDTLVDIGCGDGTLIQLIDKQLTQIIGISPSKAEADRVRPLVEEIPNTTIEEGLAQQTNLPSNIANVVICNGVFIYLSGVEVDDAFKELIRISKDNSIIYIGETPSIDEYADKKFGDSILLWLWWTLKNQGVNSFFRRVKQTLTALLSKEPLVIAPKDLFFATPENFIAQAKKYGLHLEKHFQHSELNPEGEVVKNPTRWNYIFSKK